MAPLSRAPTEHHAMSTLEARIQAKLGGFAQRKSDAAHSPEDAAAAQDDETEYLLRLGQLLQPGNGFAEEGAGPHQVDGSIDSFVTTTKRDDKEALLRCYMADVEEDEDVLNDVNRERIRGDVGHEWACTECGGQTFQDTRQAQLICTVCGVSRNHFEAGPANMSFNDVLDANVTTQISYKRATHLSDLLSSLQARTGVEIEPKIMDAVRAELKKDRISDRSKITVSRVRQYLKKNGFSKYYEHAATICGMVSAMPPLMLDPDVEKELKRDFQLVEKAFDALGVATGRSNLISYSYVLHQLASLRGLDELASRCTLLKSRQKLFLLDKIWSKICLMNKWTFKRTI